ncbi:hypothetical protein C8R43DRAFT_271540 [Mycena crocata]|nr:hypothetical protein C8R43DRAFT_271540 [Mycena crocata]
MSFFISPPSMQRSQPAKVPLSLPSMQRSQRDQVPLSLPSMHRSKPAKALPSKRLSAKARTVRFSEESDLRRYALKRSSLEKAAEVAVPDLGAVHFSAVDYSPTASAESTCDAVSPLSTAPPRRPSLKSARPPQRPSVSRTPSMFSTTTLSTLEFPAGGGNPAIARASLESVASSSSSSSSSRRSSIASVSSLTSTDSTSSSLLSSILSKDSESSTPTTRLRLRAIPRLAISAMVNEFVLFKKALIPESTPEDLLTTEPIPIIRDTHRRPKLLASRPLPAVEKRTRFLCPPRECKTNVGNALWSDFENTQVRYT